MSNFASDYSSSQAANVAQLRHYGLPTGEPPQHQMNVSHSSRGQVPQRKPVNAGTPRNQQGPYPPMPSSATRKPVGGVRTPRAQSPASTNRSVSSDLTKPLPAIPRASSPAQSEERPPSSSSSFSSSFGFRGRKRTDSNASKRRSRSGSTSIAESVKAVGKWVRSKAEIVAMNESQRQSFLQGAHKHNERKLERERQHDPSTRPMHQKQYIANKHNPGVEWGIVGSEAHYSAELEQRASRESFAKKHREMHARACAAAQLEGRPRPMTPEEARLASEKASLNSAERADAREQFNGHGQDSELVPRRIGNVDLMAIKLSKSLDAFKPRKGSQSSDMDFADTAPEGSMSTCSECAMPFTTYLKGGLCVDCYAYRKNKSGKKGDHHSSVSQADITDSQVPSLVARKKGHNPKSPEDDAQGGDLYMHLPTQHRIRKVRETMYEDPGNPFSVEEFEFSLLPSTTYVQTAGSDVDDSDANDSESWHYTDYEAPQASHKMEHDQLSIFSDPFDLVNVHNGFTSNRGTWDSFQSNRRSMSVDIGFMPAPKMMDEYYMSDREQIWSDRVPTLHIQHPSGTLFTVDTRRDTRFYDFYDDLLAEYGIEEGGHITHHTQQTLPVEI